MVFDNMRTPCCRESERKKAAAGFAPANSGFADRRLATWLYRPCDWWTNRDEMSPMLMLITGQAGDGI